MTWFKPHNKRRRRKKNRWHAHRIHVWFIYLPRIWLIFMVNVGKYTSPMDPMAWDVDSETLICHIEFSSRGDGVSTTKTLCQVIQAVTFWSASWRSPTAFERVTYITIPKRSRSQNCQVFFSFVSFLFSNPTSFFLKIFSLICVISSVIWLLFSIIHESLGKPNPNPKQKYLPWFHRVVFDTYLRSFKRNW